MDISTFLNDTVLKYFLTLLAAIACALGARALNDARAYLTTKTGQAISDVVFEEVRRLVLAAEAYFVGPDQGEAKMKWVITQALAFLKDKGITTGFDAETLTHYAEAALKQEINNYPDLKSFTADETKLNLPPAAPTAPAA